MDEVSGMEFFDRSALRAVVLSDPMPPCRWDSRRPSWRPFRFRLEAPDAWRDPRRDAGADAAGGGHRVGGRQTPTDVRIDIRSGEGRRIRVHCEALQPAGDRTPARGACRPTSAGARPRMVGGVHGEPGVVLRAGPFDVQATVAAS